MTLPILLQLKAKFLKSLFKNYSEASISIRLNKIDLKINEIEHITCIIKVTISARKKIKLTFSTLSALILYLDYYNGHGASL